LDLSKLFNSLDEVKPEIAGIRRDLHKHPELGFELNRTSEIVKDFLKKWGLEVETNIAKCGVTGLIKARQSGKTIALRADMDALPILEQNEISYRSTIDGRMHACGHDGHTAMLLGTAKVLSLYKDELKGNIKFIFQPAEEGPAPGGAKPMIEYGVLKDVDAIFGLHISTAYKTGTIAINRYNAMASTDIFEIELLGKGGHAGLPHEAIDAIAMAVRVYNNIQIMVSRELDPLEPVVVSVGTLNGGYASNVIADSVKMSGTIRTHCNELRGEVIKKIENIVRSVAQMAGGDYKLNIIPGLPPLVNHTEYAKFVENSCKTLLGNKNVVILNKPSMGAEDFAYYLEHIPGAFFWLGARNESKGFINSPHNPKFDFDEDALPIGAKIFIQLAVDFLSNA